MSARIGVSPLTGRVLMGRVNKAGNAFIGEQRDMTGDFLRCIVEKSEYHGGEFEITAGDKKWFVKVEQVKEQA